MTVRQIVKQFVRDVFTRAQEIAKGRPLVRSQLIAQEVIYLAAADVLCDALALELTNDPETKLLTNDIEDDDMAAKKKDTVGHLSMMTALGVIVSFFQGQASKWDALHAILDLAAILKENLSPDPQPLPVFGAQDGGDLAGLSNQQFAARVDDLKNQLSQDSGVFAAGAFPWALVATIVYEAFKRWWDSRE